MPDKKLINKMWNAAKPVRGQNPREIRQDPYGNRISKSQFGETGPRGWEIDHIKPESRGGSDHTRNLQAMQTKKNRELGDTMKKRSRHNQ